MHTNRDAKERTQLRENHAFVTVDEQEYRVEFKVCDGLIEQPRFTGDHQKTRTVVKATVSARTPTGWKFMDERVYPFYWGTSGRWDQYESTYDQRTRQKLAERAVGDMLHPDRFLSKDSDAKRFSVPLRASERQRQEEERRREREVMQVKLAQTQKDISALEMQKSKREAEKPARRPRPQITEQEWEERKRAEAIVSPEWQEWRRRWGVPQDDPIADAFNAEMDRLQGEGDAGQRKN